MNFAGETRDDAKVTVCIRIDESVLNMMDFPSKMMNSASNMMDFVLK